MKTKKDNIDGALIETDINTQQSQYLFPITS